VTTRVFFLVDETRFDTTPAREFGEEHFIYPTTRDVPWSDTDILARQVLAALMEARYDPSSDFIAATGPAAPLAVYVATTLAAYGEIKLLMFNASVRRYRQRVLGARDPAGDRKEVGVA